MNKTTGWKSQVLIGGNEGGNQVNFKTELLMEPEAYLLEVQKNRIEIKAAKQAGFFLCDANPEAIASDRN